MAGKTGPEAGAETVSGSVCWGALAGRIFLDGCWYRELPLPF